MLGAICKHLSVCLFIGVNGEFFGSDQFTEQLLQAAGEDGLFSQNPDATVYIFRFEKQTGICSSICCSENTGITIYDIVLCACVCGMLM